MRRAFPTAALLFYSILTFVLSTAVFSAREIITEAKKKLIPGGPGQQPFDVTRHTIAIAEIQGGGPGRDDIPALGRPNFLTADQARGLLRDSDRVIGVFFNGEAKAYPIRILNYHELVNDVAGGRPVLVTW